MVIGLFFGLFSLVWFVWLLMIVKVGEIVRNMHFTQFSEDIQKHLNPTAVQFSIDGMHIFVTAYTYNGIVFILYL
jgi:hypothetical protein